jgi:hypothetical protein
MPPLQVLQREQAAVLADLPQGLVDRLPVRSAVARAVWEDHPEGRLARHRDLLVRTDRVSDERDIASRRLD